MLIATGAFPLTANLLLTNANPGNASQFLKAALTANAIGILFGAIAVYGEAMLAKGAVRALVDREIAQLKGRPNPLSGKPYLYTLPFYMKYMERCFYLSMFVCLTLWVAFIWLN